MPSTTQWTYFAAFFGAGMLFLLLSVFIFLPIIILAPTKFGRTTGRAGGDLCLAGGTVCGIKRPPPPPSALQR